MPSFPRMPVNGSLAPPPARRRRDPSRYTVRFNYSSSSLSHRLPSFQRMPVHGFSAPLKFTFHVPAWTPSPASMRSPTISPSKAQVRSLYFSTLSGEHARKTLSPMPLGPTSVPALCYAVDATPYHSFRGTPRPHRRSAR